MDKLPELYKAKGLIIDLRKNGGGSTNIGAKILQYFMKDSIMQHERNFTRQHLAAFKAWGVYVKPADTIYNSWNKKAWYYNHDKMLYASPTIVPTLSTSQPNALSCRLCCLSATIPHPPPKIF